MQQIIILIFTIIISRINFAQGDSRPFCLLAANANGEAHNYVLHEQSSQNNSLVLKNTSPCLTSYITDDKKLKFSNGKYATIDKMDNFLLKETDYANATIGFSIKRGVLCFEGNNQMYSTKKNNEYFITFDNTKNAFGIKLVAWGDLGRISGNYPINDQGSTTTIIDNQDGSLTFEMNESGAEGKDDSNTITPNNTDNANREQPTNNAIVRRALCVNTIVGIIFMLFL